MLGGSKPAETPGTATVGEATEERKAIQSEGAMQESVLYRHARQELDLAMGDQDDEDGMNALIKKQVLELMAVFVTQGHSGSTAPAVSGLFIQLANYGNLTPVEDNEDDWQDAQDITGDPSMKGLLQHKRCGNIFKDTKLGGQFEGLPYITDKLVVTDGATQQQGVAGIISMPFSSYDPEIVRANPGDFTKIVNDVTVGQRVLAVAEKKRQRKAKQLAEQQDT